MKNRFINTAGRCLLVLLIAGMIAGSLIPDMSTFAEEKKNKETGTTYSEEDITFHITLDPGHGGVDTGAEAFGTSEKKLTVKLGKMLKEELLKYENVTVKMTRKKDKFLTLKRRTQKALNQNADLMISLHFDSYDPGCAYSSGCSAIVSKKGTYRPAMTKEEKRVARSILSELSDLGVKNHGLIRRLSTDGETYPDGSTADYYGVIRRGKLNKLPTILVEHSFIDSEHDYYNFLDTDEKLREMARADARGIARFLRLRNKETGKILKPVKEGSKDQVCRIKEGSYISIRAKSYNLDQYRKKNGITGETVEEENKAEEATQAGTADNPEQSTEEAVTAEANKKAGDTGRNPGAREKSIYLIAILSAMLLGYYALIWYKERRHAG